MMLDVESKDLSQECTYFVSQPCSYKDRQSKDLGTDHTTAVQGHRAIPVLHNDKSSYHKLTEGSCMQWKHPQKKPVAVLIGVDADSRKQNDCNSLG